VTRTILYQARTVEGYSDNNFVNLIVEYTYNTSGDLVSKTDHVTGDIFTYYASGLLESKTLTEGDADDIIYSLYENLDFYGNGEYGRVTKIKYDVEQADGTLSQEITYANDTDDQARTVYGYSDNDLEVLKTVREYSDTGNLIRSIEIDQTFIKGANLPWVNYGFDIGSAEGNAFHDGLSLAVNRAALEAELDNWEGDYIRAFIFNDLRAGMNFDGTGTPTGFTANVYEDMQVLLDAAAERGIKVMPVLFDYLIADGDSSGSCAEHPDLITDPTKRTELVDILTPFITHFSSHEALYAWDIMNEPEYTLTGNGMGGVINDVADLQALVQSFITVIHNADALATVGSRDRDDMLDLWTGMGLDIYQFHFYDNMVDVFGVQLDHLFTSDELALLGDAPVIAGELGSIDVAAKLEILARYGYDGGLFWQDEQADDQFTITEAERQAIRDWFYGTTYTYYDDINNQIRSKSTTFMDEFGNMYYMYSNEQIHGAGTSQDPHYGNIQPGSGSFGPCYPEKSF